MFYPFFIYRREGKYKASSLKSHMGKYRNVSGLTEPQTWEHAFSLLERMLTMDPQRRISAAEAKEHKYFKVLLIGIWLIIKFF